MANWLLLLPLMEIKIESLLQNKIKSFFIVHSLRHSFELFIH